MVELSSFDKDYKAWKSKKIYYPFFKNKVADVCSDRIKG